MKRILNHQVLPEVFERYQSNQAAVLKDWHHARRRHGEPIQHSL
jgi:hypothetical protein